MSLTPANLITGTLIASPVGSVGGPTVATHWWVKRAVIANTDTAVHTVTIYRIPSGGSVTAANILLPAYPLSASGNPGASYVVAKLTDLVLNPGDTIQAVADTTAKVSIEASGFTF